jgi:hypothetical protein
MSDCPPSLDELPSQIRAAGATLSKLRGEAEAEAEMAQVTVASQSAANSRNTGSSSLAAGFLTAKKQVRTGQGSMLSLAVASPGFLTLAWTAEGTRPAYTATQEPEPQRTASHP